MADPKRFTVAPTKEVAGDFFIRENLSLDTVYQGVYTDHVGDFSDFDPISNLEYEIIVKGDTSFPFGIGQWWLERVTYEKSIEFMVQSRHYVGNTSSRRRGSFGWRDDHHFGWELNVLVPQYLSNPVAYDRMPRLVEYRMPNANQTGLWGVLEPYSESAPDIVKLIHWGADVIITQQLTHEHLKAQLAYFLYAWPFIERWLPQQNFDVALAYAKNTWSMETADRAYPFDRSPEHNLFALKTLMGTTKGELPPGTSVAPNLLMFEVMKRLEDKDSMQYMNAAVNQVEWMLDNIDWEDSISTKGQRMSEHITMTALSLFETQYPEYAPAGLGDDIEEWIKIMIRRSGNLWDFRKLTDGINWTPFGDAATQWNEPGNVLGFPACALAALRVVKDSSLQNRMMELVYAHMDNAFGRNPVGRHFSYDGAREIEGVDLGWFSFYRGGVGLLENVPFVFDGAPKNDHYPYHPELENVGWTEGWIQFNLAFNISLAYMAYNDVNIDLKNLGDSLELKIKAPLNFNYRQVEQIEVVLEDSLGRQDTLVLNEMSENSLYFHGIISMPSKLKKVSYGYGYMEKYAVVPNEILEPIKPKDTVNLPVLVKSIMTTGTLSITEDGGFTQLIAQVTPDSADNLNVKWSIIGEDLGATVDAKGKLTASGQSDGNGMVLVVVNAMDTSGVSDTVEVVISGQVNGLQTVNGATVQETFMVVPNPTSQSFNIYGVEMKGQKGWLKVLNSSGQLVLRKALTSNESFKGIEVNVASGYYLLIVYDGVETFRSKLLIN